MKRVSGASVAISAAVAATMTLMSAGTASATVYTDTVGDQFSEFAHLDIASVKVTNDATNLSLKVNLTGDIVATNWGKYLVGVDSVAGGITSGNAWGKPISMSSGMDYFIGSWVDFGNGFEIYRDNGGAWVRDHASYDATNPLPAPIVTPNSLTLTFPLAYLNLTDGSTFNFDVYSSGGGGSDSANDASSNPGQSITDWSVPYDSGALVSSYTVHIPTTGSAWNLNGSGSWNAAANWTGGVPNAAGAAATFGGVATAPVAVSVDQAVVVGAITFDNAAAYTIGGPAGVTLDASSGAAAINVAGGSHSITTPLALADDTTVTVAPAASTLSVADLRPGAAVTLTKSGAGTLAVNRVRAAGLVVSNGTLKVAPSGGAAASASNVTALNIANGAKLDLGDNKLITMTPAGTATGGGVYDGVQGQVQRAYAGGAWSGNGLTTSMPQALDGLTTIGVATGEQLGIDTFAGQSVSAASTIAFYTYAGDTNFDGQVTGDDYGTIDFSILVPGADGYYNGDFNYDGVINGDDYGVIDFTIIAQGAPFPTSGASAGLSGVTAVPEPSACGFAIVAIAALSRRRRLA